jgi:2-C-methyl-D-erythritol 4-phosphate cytidylyltransferase
MAPPGGLVLGIVVAAGQGERFGAPKQFVTLGDATVIDHAVSVAAAACDAVVVVLPPDREWATHVQAVSWVAGGETRSASVRAALAAAPEGTDIIVVHDAARPLATKELFDAVIGAVRAGADGAVPAIPVTDTLKRVHGDRIVGTVARDGLVAVQTPQAFRAHALRGAHAHGDTATDDSALVEAAGGKVVSVPGERRNIKITEPADLALAEALLAEMQS